MASQGKCENGSYESHYGAYYTISMRRDDTMVEEGMRPKCGFPANFLDPLRGTAMKLAMRVQESRWNHCNPATSTTLVIVIITITMIIISIITSTTTETLFPSSNLPCFSLDSSTMFFLHSFRASKIMKTTGKVTAAGGKFSPEKPLLLG